MKYNLPTIENILLKKFNFVIIKAYSTDGVLRIQFYIVDCAMHPVK